MAAAPEACGASAKKAPAATAGYGSEEHEARHRRQQRERKPTADVHRYPEADGGTHPWARVGGASALPAKPWIPVGEGGARLGTLLRVRERRRRRGEARQVLVQSSLQDSTERAADGPDPARD